MKTRQIILFFTVVMYILTAAVWAEPIKIAAIFPQTGAAAENNINSINGVRLAVEELNMEGGILGRLIELIIINTHSTPIGAKVAATQAVEAGVSGIIGPSWSSESLAAAKVAQENGIPLISTLSTHPELTKIGDYIFRICFNDQFQGMALARFVREELNAETAVMMVDIISAYSMELSNIFAHHFEQKGGKILLKLQYKRTTENYTALLQEAENAKPDIIFIPSHIEIRTIAQQAEALGMFRILVGGDGWHNISFVFSDKTALKQGYYTTHWAKETGIEAFHKFMKKHSQPEYFTTGFLLSYDAVMLLADAITRAGSDKPAAVRDALAQTKNFPGTTGFITMNQDGDTIKNAVLIKIKNGVKFYDKIIIHEP